MHLTSERRLDDGSLEREFALGEIPGILWTPTSAPGPLILLGHPGGLRKMHRRLAGRARQSAANGFAAATAGREGGPEVADHPGRAPVAA